MSLRKAVDAHCKQCIYDHCEKGTWLEQVERCESVECPLWTFRPVSNATIAKRRELKREKQIG